MCATKDAGWCDAIECDDTERMIECLEQDGYVVLRSTEKKNLDENNLVLRKEICRLKEVNHTLVEQVQHWKNKKW
jgi:hypothetical protein